MLLLRSCHVKGAVQNVPTALEERLTHFDLAIAERPSAPARRRQILDAARERFRCNGFHATSMAEIAAGAGMSVGHMYRYFVGKDEIIVAIVEADVTLWMEEMIALEAEHADAREAVKYYVERVVRRLANRQNAALFLEIRAEAARNPKVAEIVRAARKEPFDRLRTMLTRAYSHCSTEKIDQRAEVLGVFLESVVFKSVLSPDFNDEEAVADMIGFVGKLFE